MDQPFWGQKMFELGVSSSPIPFKDITNEKVVSAIQYVMEGEHSEAIKKKAHLIAEQIKQEEGDPIATAIDLLVHQMETQPFVVPRILGEE